MGLWNPAGSGQIALRLKGVQTELMASWGKSDAGKQSFLLALPPRALVG